MLGWAGLGLRPEGWWAGGPLLRQQCSRAHALSAGDGAGRLAADHRRLAADWLVGHLRTCAAAAAKRHPPSPTRPPIPPRHPCLNTGHQCTAVQEAGGRRPALRRRYPGRFHYWHRSVSGMAGKYGRWLACAPAGLHPAHLLHRPHPPHPANSQPAGLPPCPPNPPTHPSPCPSA